MRRSLLTSSSNAFHISRMSRRPFWSQYALAASLAIPLAAVACIGSAAVATWAWIAILSFVALAGLLAGATWTGVALPWHPILWPTLAFGGWTLAQYFLRLTVYPAATLNGLIQLTACACELYLALFAFRDEQNVKRAGTVLWLFTGVLASEALAQFFLAGGYIYWYRDARYATPTGPFIYHNHFAGAMDLLVPVSIAVAARVRRRQRDQPWLARLRRGVFPALALAAVVVSQSRGGLFAILFEGAFAVALFWPQLRRSDRVRRGALVGALALIGFTLLAGWQPLLRRVTSLQYHDASAVDRERVAATCLAIWHAKPWTGTGFDTFAEVYPQYQTFDSGQRWEEAHNDYAQMLAEDGLIGAAAVLGFLLILGIHGVRSTWGEAHPKPLRAAALVGSSGFLFHSVGDFLFHSPADALLFFAITALALAGTNARKPQKSQLTRKQGDAAYGPQAVGSS